MDNLEGQDLQAAYWYNTHQNQVRTAFYGIAIGLVAILWLVNIILAIKFLLLQGKTNQALNDFAATQVIYDSIQAPQGMTINSVDAVSHANDTVDVYAVLTNPNIYHVGKFSYIVTINGNNYTFNDGSIMPNAKSYIVLADLAGTAASSAELTIVDVTWERVRGPAIETEFLVNDLVVNRSNLAVANLTNADSNENVNAASNTNTNSDDNTDFARPDEETDTDTVTPTGEIVTQATGILTNASAYGFRRVVVTALLKNTAGVVLGVQQQVFTDMASFNDYDLTFTWRRQFDFNAVAEVIVETDTWHDANLILPGQD